MSNSKISGFSKASFSKTGLLTFVLAFGVIGGIIALSSFALTPQAGQGTQTVNNTHPPVQITAPANLANVADLLSHYGQKANSSQGDLNGDGKVTAADLSILLANYKH